MLQASFYPVLNQFSLIPHLTKPARPHAPSPYDHLLTPYCMTPTNLEGNKLNETPG